MKLALSLLALVLIALILPFLLPAAGKIEGADPNSNLPWQIVTDGHGGSSVFGLHPGVSTLAEVKQRLGDDLDVAIIAAPHEAGSLEGFYTQVPLGFVMAKVIVTVDASPERIAAMRERALKAQYMESSTRKIRLHPDDLAAAEQMPVRAIVVIPSVNLDEATVVERFGKPGERLVVSEKRVHLLYPEKGLDVTVDADGKELLQYVAPRDFSLLRAPLGAAAESGDGRQ